MMMIVQINNILISKTFTVKLINYTVTLYHMNVGIKQGCELLPLGNISCRLDYEKVTQVQCMTLN